MQVRQGRPKSGSRLPRAAHLFGAVAERLRHAHPPGAGGNGVERRIRLRQDLPAGVIPA